MKKVIVLMLAVFVVMVAGIFVGSADAVVYPMVTRKVAMIYPQMTQPNQFSPQLLILDGPEIPGCPGNNFVFYDDEPMILDVLRDARKENAQVQVRYGNSGQFPRDSFIPAIDDAALCRVIGVGLAPATFLEVPGLIINK
ncbi:MAG: hypothetical protein WC238_01080 [Parcubacteria group bacterium]|jgi:hypothetical protein